MKYFLDTNICIYFLKGLSEKLKKSILDRHPDEIKIPAIVKAELLYGAEKSNFRDDNMIKVEEFLLPFEIVPFSDRDTIIYAEIRSNLEKKGIPIGPKDLIIAATVLRYPGTLITNNKKEFNRIEGLNIENWID